MIDGQPAFTMPNATTAELVQTAFSDRFAYPVTAPRPTSGAGMRARAERSSLQSRQA